ncbi:glycosyl transferase-like protein, partial [Dinothrombium tinctorium]
MAKESLANSSENNKRLTILCASLSDVGHVNTVLGIAIALRRKNHRVVFATDKSWEGKFAKFGIEEQLYNEIQYGDEKDEKNRNSIEQAAYLFEEFQKPLVDRLTNKSDIKRFINRVYGAVAQRDALLEIVSKVKPDVILFDNLVPFPCLIETNLPLIYVFSANPLKAIDDERLPPPFFGLPLNDSSEWFSKRKLFVEARKPFRDETNKILREYNLPLLRENRTQFVSTNLNVYVYPKPLMEDYLRLCPLGDEWIGLDHSIRESDESFELPPNFKSENDKLIFLSLGSIASRLFQLMSRLVKILSKCKHKVIVVTGKFHDKYELANNMWGQPFLPQLEVLPLVDLVITHGGNNTFIETLYFGKPM